MTEEKCYFDRQSYCAALTTKQCHDCAFHKTGWEYIEGKKHTNERLAMLGLEVCIVTVCDQKIITTRKKGANNEQNDN